MFADLFIVVMYLGTMMGMVLFLAFVCRVGDLGFYLFGLADSYLQDRHMTRFAQKKDVVEIERLKRAA
jgi:hypothetical protein